MKGVVEAFRMPKVKTLQIVWHGKEPVFSVDFHPDGSLATAGADKEIKVWEVMQNGLFNPLSLDHQIENSNCLRRYPSKMTDMQQ